MKKIKVLRLFSIYLSSLLFIGASCNISTNSYSNNDNKTFNNVDSVLEYYKETSEHKSLLFALVTKDIENSQSLGWNILRDKEIIATAKKNYVLIIIDPAKISLPNDIETNEFQNILNMDKESPYFVVTNHAFYPFRQFTLKTEKETIIENLEVGEGP